MSRVGKYPIKLPVGVSVSYLDGMVTVRGKLGRLSFKLPSNIKLDISDDKIVAFPSSKEAGLLSMWGTARAILANMVKGVSTGYKQTLEINGTGYRASVQGAVLVLNLGFSHDISFSIPKDVSITTPRPTVIIIEGVDKRLVGQVAAEIRTYRLPEPYKGKGIKYEGEKILRKEGKKK